jgi:cytochrome b
MNQQPSHQTSIHTEQVIVIWDILVRLCHWGLVAAFITNYFIVEPGRQIHEIVGYMATALIAVRLFWGFTRTKASLASFKHIDLSKRAFKTHLSELKERRVNPEHGHNPFGWLMVCLVVALLLGLGVTGFLMEEIDALFGNSTLEWIHSTMSDALYASVIVHVIAVFCVQHRGRVQLIRPMLVGKRQVEKRAASKTSR